VSLHETGRAAQRNDLPAACYVQGLSTTSACLCAPAYVPTSKLCHNRLHANISDEGIRKSYEGSACELLADIAFSYIEDCIKLNFAFFVMHLCASGNYFYCSLLLRVIYFEAGSQASEDRRKAVSDGAICAMFETSCSENCARTAH
jgi:hypothetical protein